MNSISDDATDAQAPDADQDAGSAAQAAAETRAGRRAAREASEEPWYWRPVSQAAVVGAFTLIPVRSWPTWLKGGLTWGSTGLVAVLAMTPGAGRKLLEASARMTGAEVPGAQEQSAEERGAESAERAEGSQVPSSASSQRGGMSWRTRASLAAALAGINYGTWRFTWWADGAIERGLTMLRVPAPRLVQAGGAAAWTYWQARQDQRGRAERASSRGEKVDEERAEREPAQG